jgi:CheY-like chemotaxis protein
VKDGEEALKVLNDPEQRFDAAMLDIRMPGLNGRTVAEKVRAREAATQSKMMLMAAVTANAFDEDKKACLAAGFDAFIPKPLNKSDLEQFLELARTRQKQAA